MSGVLEEYTKIQKILHWLSALMVFGLFGLGAWMQGLSYTSEWYRAAPNLHIGIGFVLLVLTVVRLGLRITYGVPSMPATHVRWETLLAKCVHVIFYIALLCMAFSGYLIETMGGSTLDVLGVISIPPLILEERAPLVARYSNVVHEILAYSIVMLAILHAAGALKHHVVDKDSTLRRMV